ncbi:MAG: S1C family serine protease [Pseudohongiellaceae bacterium]|jgi:S1-C subfamily serine protease
MKKTINFLLVSTALASIILSQPSLSAPDYLSFQTEDEANNIEIFSEASPSVVYVTNTTLVRSSPFSRNVQEIPQGAGTGFVWDESGLIVTNYHVVQGANRVMIRLQDQSSWEAEIIGVAPDKDLALLKIDAPEEHLIPLPLGDSAELQVGRKVIAIGNPFGLDTTLTVGVVSALGREITSLTNRTIRDVIQTDASINPGNSGGPLLNSLGQLVGVNTQIISPSGANAGIGFAIPVNTVRRVIPQLMEFGREIRPILGISNLNDAISAQNHINGVIVAEVTNGLGSAEAGLIGLEQDQRGNIILGDVIVGIEDMAVTNSDDLLNALEQFQPGDIVEVFTRRRNQDEMSFQVELSEPI